MKRTTNELEWQVGGGSARGASHRRRNAPNQDALHWSQSPTVIAVSDGHGAAQHYLSELGSQFAVEIAVRCASNFVREMNSSSPSKIISKLDGLIQEIHREWCKIVDNHAESLNIKAPLTDIERRLPYGATLLVAASTKNALIIIQIGDGDIVVKYDNGSMVRPLPDDDMPGEQTNSLCAPNAVKDFRFAILDRYGLAEKPELLVVSTDGLSKSFANEAAFLRTIENLHGTFERKPKAKDIEAWLSKISLEGSGDDITVGFFLRSTKTDFDQRVSGPELIQTPATTSKDNFTQVQNLKLHFLIGSLIISLLSFIISMWVIFLYSNLRGELDDLRDTLSSSRNTKLIPRFRDPRLKYLTPLIQNENSFRSLKVPMVEQPE